MSHEIRTPLATVIASLDLLREQAVHPPAGRTGSGRSFGQASPEILGDILDFSRIEAGR
jgi:signal transduction histidine kinase